MKRIPYYNLHSPLCTLEDNHNMQAIYPKKLPTSNLDRVHLEYPVKRFIRTGISSETIARRWRPPGEILKPQVSQIY